MMYGRLFFNSKSLKKWVLSLGCLMGMVTGEQAFGFSHNYLNQMRSSDTSHVFVSQSVEGEYGDFLTSYRESSEKRSNTWQGVGLVTSFGLELMKFIQFSAGHTFVNLKNKSTGLESVDGSRLHAETRFVFLAPIGNLEMGGGVTGSRLDYQNKLDNASFYGSGFYYSLGLNYFITSQVSFFGRARHSNENLLNNNGGTSVRNFETNMDGVSAGFSLWL